MTTRLTQIYAPYESTESENVLKAKIDLVFVHGLNPKGAEDHGRRTWTHKNKIFWPGDLMPKILPDARILLFEYNSQVGASGAAALGLGNHADSLLDHYRALKPSYKIPIIFICHSLGGLVVKQALIKATSRNKQDPQMSEIKHLTYGIVFFGTPHQGGNGVLIGQVIESVVSSIGVTTKNSILEALKKEGQLSLEARESFRSIIEDFQYLSIVEGKPKPGFGIVVPQQSATLGLGTGRETIISVDADHSQMCKFDGDSGLFIPVKHHILQIVSQALKNGPGLEESQPSATASITIEKSPEITRDPIDLFTDPAHLQCLASLSARDQKQSLRRNAAQILPGTCGWISQNPEYLSWAGATSPRLLWLYGPPGSGKSIICSHLVSNLTYRGLKGSAESLSVASERIVLFFFCDKSDPESGGNVAAILQNLLSQLIQMDTPFQSQVLKIVVRAFQIRKIQTESRHNEITWKWETLWSVFTEAMCILRKELEVFLFVDALDECDEPSRMGPNGLSALLYSILGDPKMPKLKILLTCRQLQNVTWNSLDSGSADFENRIEIQPDLTRKDLEAVIERSVQTLSVVKGLKPHVTKRIERYLRQNANGMFLWVTLTISQLKAGKIVLHKIENTLLELPLGLNELYEGALRAIDSSRIDDVRQILTFIVCARRPLKIAELACLLERQSGTEWDGIKGDAQSLCGPLVVVQDDDVLHLLHESVRTFLTSFPIRGARSNPADAVPFVDLIEGETGFAETCMKYLDACVERIPVRRTNYKTNMLNFIKRSPLIEYAGLYWSRHMSAANTKKLRWKRFMENPDLIDNMYQLYCFLVHRESQNAPWFPGHQSILHVASFFNIPWLAELLLKEGSDPNGDFSDPVQRNLGTPLVWGSENGSNECIRKLIEYGANPNIQEYDGWTALHWAALNGHTNTVKLLLEAKTDTSLKDKTGHNAEHYAAKAGYWNIVSAIRKHTQKFTQNNFESDESTSESETDITDLYVNQRFPKEPTTNQSRKFSLSVDGKNLESSFSDLTIKSPDKVIAVMGPTGAGKSTFIQKASGEEHIIVGHSLYSETATINPYPCDIDGEMVTLVDTPGFEDSVRTEAEVLCEIAEWLQLTYQKGSKLTGIIYLHRISDNRLTNTTLRNLKMFRRLCGPNPMRNIVLATNFWNFVDEETGARREKLLTSDPRSWGKLVRRGSKVARFLGTHASALEILNKILNLDRVTLQIQKELVDEGKNLASTGAGSVVYAGLELLQQEHRADLVRLQQEMEEAIAARDSEMEEVLAQAREDSRAKLSRLETEKERLVVRV